VAKGPDAGERARLGLGTHQLPPPPPPPPPPAEPPLKPLDPLDAGVDEIALETALDIDESSLEKEPMLATEAPEYQPAVAFCTSMSANAFAHLVTDPNTIA
jgi:hypothetical protein